jgi:hypothetical protein
MRRATARAPWRSPAAPVRQTQATAPPRNDRPVQDLCLGDDPAETARHAPRPKDSSQRGRRFHPILQRDDHGVPARHFLDRGRSFRHLPGFYRDEHRIDFSDLRRIVRSVNVDLEISPDALDAKRPCAQRFQCLPAHEEHHLAAARRQPATEVSAYRACSDDSDLHLKKTSGSRRPRSGSELY